MLNYLMPVTKILYSENRWVDEHSSICLLIIINLFLSDGSAPLRKPLWKLNRPASLDTYTLAHTHLHIYFAPARGWKTYIHTIAQQHNGNFISSKLNKYK